MQQHQGFVLGESQIKLRIVFWHMNYIFFLFSQQLSRVLEKVPGFKEIRVLGFRWADRETHIFWLDLPFRIRSEYSLLGYQKSHFLNCGLLRQSARRMCLYVTLWSLTERPSLAMIPTSRRRLMRKGARTRMPQNWNTSLSRPWNRIPCCRWTFRHSALRPVSIIFTQA